ncbi:hypothetical protein DY120_02040 [Apilactobacillus micheneri]|uniref:Uncharacterized protein n=1 Tax=Apilactobacillus micheneri TaxID=1899430 RepID=A0ABY2Z014_9LACO|nr:hypothetical protein [Apilactobacillus micheneri]TPR26497.1 hypothetical protein DY114_02040 [Apilactobacillus micheneri]TPR27251.1 hypothetical protein DY111_02040 [Apilactobacillus micheneri]TPR27498.1 hypothetical protein DY113_06990 [Apilactobacillus micheneri]TPR32014.1 hypothetical protein DY117_02040 [Apilactobacillus micheneri]TPR32418.1 hypothetical protein DY120_02040 [Apilactobacillus micheneri]
MMASDFSVQIKLIVMYAIGVIAMLLLLGFLYYKQRKLLTKNIIPILIIAIIMILILAIVITLP